MTRIGGGRTVELARGSGFDRRTSRPRPRAAVEQPLLSPAWLALGATALGGAGALGRSTIRTERLHRVRAGHERVAQRSGLHAASVRGTRAPDLLPAARRRADAPFRVPRFQAPALDTPSQGRGVRVDGRAARGRRALERAQLRRAANGMRRLLLFTRCRGPSLAHVIVCRALFRVE